MGFLERLKASQSADTEKWKLLTDLDQLDEIDKTSAERFVVIFKHSTSCGISAGAKYRLESEWSSWTDDIDFYYLDLLSYRHISNQIVSRYGVRHESPQILAIRSGEVIYDTSHHRINASELKVALS